MDKEDSNHNAPPLGSPQWFESKLGEILEELRERFFGYPFHVMSGKTIRRDTSNEALIEMLFFFEKYLEVNKNTITEFLEPFGFLKLVLEKDAPLFGFEEELFGVIGIKRDRSGISLPQKNAIAVQVAAQVLWQLEKGKIPTIVEMRKRLLDKENPLFRLLELNRFGTRAIDDWISEVFPLPKHVRKGRPSKAAPPEDSFERLVHIPGVFMDEGKVVNFPKLRFAILCLARILKTQGFSSDQIRESNFIRLYQIPLLFYLSLYIRGWIAEGFNENGSIFCP